MADSSVANLEVEASILGCLLADTAMALWPQVASLLKPDHFSEAMHARIFAAAETFLRGNRPASPLTLKTYFEADQTLQEIGGTAYLSQLVANACPAIALKSNVELLVDLAARRSAIAAAETLIAEASLPQVGEPFRTCLSSHVETMQRLFDAGMERKTVYSLGQAATDLCQRVQRIRSGEIDRNAVKTGIKPFDGFTGGLHRGEYIILGGRPSMGKTAVACQLAYNIAEAGGGVFYASLEMPVSLLSPRLTSCRLWTPGAEEVVDYQRILRGGLNDSEMRWMESAAKEVSHWPFIIDDAPGLSASELEARAQMAKARMERKGHSLSLVVVDHLHKMRHPGAQSKVSEYTEISARLAEMAKRLDCPVVALAQLNRGVESREDKRPQLSDLRESGSIEQDADTVLFVYRPAYYLDRERLSDPAKEADRLAVLQSVGNKLELIIEKQRSGPIGNIELWADMAANVVRDPSDLGLSWRAAA